MFVCVCARARAQARTHAGAAVTRVEGCEAARVGYKRGERKTEGGGEGERERERERDARERVSPQILSIAVRLVKPTFGPKVGPSALLRAPRDEVSSA
jgi:hypothetical protein